MDLYMGYRVAANLAETGWAQGTFQGPQGRCGNGAVASAFGIEDPWQLPAEIYIHLHNQLMRLRSYRRLIRKYKDPFFTIIKWNDKYMRRQEEVVAALRATAVRLELELLREVQMPSWDELTREKLERNLAASWETISREPQPTPVI